jgi:hypothetical protein
MNSDAIKMKAIQLKDAALDVGASFKYFILFIILIVLSVSAYGINHNFIKSEWWFSIASVIIFLFSLFLKFILNISTIYIILFVLVAFSELTFLVDRFAGIVMTSLVGFLIFYILYLVFIRKENVNASVNAFFSDISLSDPIYAITKITTFICNYFLKGILVQIVKNFMLIIFMIYLALVVYVYTKQPYQVVSDNKSIFLFLFLFIGFALLSLLVMGLEAFIPFITSFIKYTIVIAIVIGIIMAVLHVYTNVPIIANTVLFILNIAILVGILAMVIRFIGAEAPNYISGPPTWSSLLFKTIIYIPCLFLNLADYFRGELKLAQRQWTYVILLFFEIIFIALLFLLPKVFDAVVNHNGEVILDKVLPLNKNNESLDIITTNADNSTITSLTPSLADNVKTNTPHYSYGISAWFYIHPEPPKNSYYTANSGTGISIFNFATDSNPDSKTLSGAPNVLFDPSGNQLIISVLTETNNTENIVVPKQILLQRWNHLFINFNNNGIMDVFLNSHLESSTPNIIPKLPKTLIVGSSVGGIYGQACNIVYYKDVVGSQGISWIYNTHKSLNPPLKPNF